VITLERTPCFGTCPVYRVSLWNDGRIAFDGRRHVAHQGAAAGSVEPAVVDSLLAELVGAGYFELDTAYVYQSPGCGRYATDSPSVITSVTARGRTRRIQHDYGCQDAPAELGRLERRIDEVAGSSRWVGGESR
jgi:hypothetical protein